MARFIALEDIGSFKKGQDVPEENALVWLEMYKVSPVQRVEDAPRSVELVPSPNHVKEDLAEKKPAKKMWGAKK